MPSCRVRQRGGLLQWGMRRYLERGTLRRPRGGQGAPPHMPTHPAQRWPAAAACAWHSAPLHSSLGSSAARTAGCSGGVAGGLLPAGAPGRRQQPQGVLGAAAVWGTAPGRPWRAQPAPSGRAGGQLRGTSGRTSAKALSMAGSNVGLESMSDSQRPAVSAATAQSAVASRRSTPHAASR